MPKKHIFRTCWKYWQRGIRCPECNEYQKEKRLGEILETLYPGLVRSQDNLGFLGRLRVDYSVSSLKLAFEYDGEHHFRPVRYGGMSIEKARKALKSQQIRDKRKSFLCKKNGYTLVRIAYNEDLTFDIVRNKVRCIDENA